MSADENLIRENNMRHYRKMLHYWLCSLVFTLTMPIIAGAGQYEDFRFPRENQLTKDGYPTPLSGQPITKTPVIAKKKGVTLKKYPEHYIPGQEKLGDNEMRITMLGFYLLIHVTKNLCLFFLESR